MSYQLLGKYLFSGEIMCVTGLHIGGATTGVEIGGLDNPVIKDPLTEMPYIPGSGLKGKLRSLSEWSLGLIATHSKHDGYAAYECTELAAPCPPVGDKGYEPWRRALLVGSLYGASSDVTEVRTVAGPSRLTVRDAFATEDTKKLWEEWLGHGIYTEVKTENTLDRLTAEANPRPIERVPAKSAFDFKMIVDAYQLDGDQPSVRELLEHLWTAMLLLEHSSLGGSGSRGHGQIEFKKLNLIWRPVDYYKTGAGQVDVPLPNRESLEELIRNSAKIWPQ